MSFAFASPYLNHFFRIAHPQLPYNGDMPEGLANGKQIYINGHVHDHSNKFIIDLLTHNGIGLHMSNRFDENAIVRNTCLNDDWGREERSGNFPYYRGQPFELILTIHHDHFHATVNGAHVFDYHHRVPINEIHRLRIDGDVSIESIVYSHAGGRAHRDQEIFNPPIPFAIPIQDGLRPGRLIQIDGHLRHDTNRFYFNLQNGADKTGDILFHVSVRFDDPGSSEPVIVRNQRKNGTWGKEERAIPYFPFTRGSPFQVLLLCEQNEWKMAVNGQHFVSFHHRDSHHNADHLYIHGDIDVSAIRQF